MTRRGARAQGSGSSKSLEGNKQMMEMREAALAS